MKNTPNITTAMITAGTNHGSSLKSLPHLGQGITPPVTKKSNPF
jgi:hypothetical protein